MGAGVAGAGFTVTVTVVVEAHVPATAEIVNVVVCEVGWVFVNVPVMVDPEPLFGIPVTFAVLFLVQVKVVPATLLGFVILI